MTQLHAVAVQADGKIVVAGYHRRRHRLTSPWPATTPTAAWTPPSTPTASSPPTSAPAISPKALAVQADGKIVAAG